VLLCTIGRKSHLSSMSDLTAVRHLNPLFEDALSSEEKEKIAKELSDAKCFVRGKFVTNQTCSLMLVKH